MRKSDGFQWHEPLFGSGIAAPDFKATCRMRTTSQNMSCRSQIISKIKPSGYLWGRGVLLVTEKMVMLVIFWGKEKVNYF